MWYSILYYIKHVYDIISIQGLGYWEVCFCFLLLQNFLNTEQGYTNRFSWTGSFTMNSSAQQLSTCQKTTFFHATHTVIHCSGLSQATGYLIAAIQFTFTPHGIQFHSYNFRKQSLSQAYRQITQGNTCNLPSCTSCPNSETSSWFKSSSL
jgi:hypothetical protein